MHKIKFIFFDIGGVMIDWRNAFKTVTTKFFKLRKLKVTKTKKYLEKSIERSLEIREIAKEIEVLAGKIGKLHDKVIMPDIKNAIHLAKSAAKSALENIKTNKQALAKLK